MISTAYHKRATDFRAGGQKLIGATNLLMSHAFHMDLSSWIRAERKRKAWSQRDLAKALGITQGAVGQWETDGTRPSLKSLLDMARVFGSSVAPFLGAGRAYPGELVEGEEELLVVHAFREMGPEQRTLLANMLRGAADAKLVAPESPAIEQAPSKRKSRRAG